MEQNVQSVTQMVRRYLQRQYPGGATLDVVAQSIYQEYSIWHVPVSSSHEPPKRYEYYEALAEVETDLQENDDLNVFLLPIMPEETGCLRPDPTRPTALISPFCDCCQVY